MIYDSVMRQRGGQLGKGYGWKMRMSWVPAPWEHRAWNDACGDSDRAVTGMYSQGDYLSCLFSPQSEKCNGTILILFFYSALLLKKD